MRNVWKHGAALLRRVIWLGMGLQTLLALLWMLNNMGIEHGFGMNWSSAETVREAGQLWGMFYPLMLKMIMGMAKYLPIPYYCIVYFLQLVLAYAAGVFLLYQLTDWRKSRLFGAGAVLLSVPMALQGHLALLPYSLTGSLVLGELGACIALYRSRDKTMVKMGTALLCWGLSALCMKEFLWIGMIPILWVGVCLFGGRKKQAGHLWKMGVTMLLVVLLTGAVGVLVHTHRTDTAFGGKQLLVARSVWSNLYALSEEWPGELREIIGEENLKQAMEDPQAFQDRFFEGFERLDKEQQRGYLGLMLDSAWEKNQKQMLLELGYDGAGYLLPGVIVKKQLEGAGFISLTGVNYAYLLAGNGTLGSIWLHFYCNWFLIAMVLAVLIKIGDVLYKREKADILQVRLGLTGAGISVLMAGVTAIWYTLVVIGAYDYKQMGWWPVIWCLWTILLATGKEEE